MIIYNIRLGFATNSSSTHSLIFLKSVEDKDIEYGDFGWDHFVAASNHTKKNYLTHTIFKTLCEHVDEKSAKIIAENLTGFNVDSCDLGYGLDHQSLYVIPYNWNGDGIDYEFLKEFQTFMLQDDLVILGGNDNEHAKHPLDDGNAFVLPLPLDGYPKEWICRKDSRGYWTLFNKKTGGKIQMSFPTPDSKFEPVNNWCYNAIKGLIKPDKADTPELIDLKITDYCDKECDFCYQGSSTLGKHAEFDIYNLASIFRDLKIFEVAIGGGEPTKHPKFPEILEEFKEHGITPSFSTGDLNWIFNEKIRTRIFKNIGSFAFSTNDPREIDEFAGLIQVFGKGLEIEPSLHYIMGIDYYWFEKYLETAYKYNLPIVLLDYKEPKIKRCRHTQNGNYDNWLDKIEVLRNEHRCPSISIDTPLAEKFEEQIKKFVDSISFFVREGSFSMYIDLVDKKMGPSSYCSSEEMVPFSPTYSDNMSEQIKSIFETF